VSAAAAVVFSLIFIAYFAAWNATQLVLGVVSARLILRHVRTRHVRHTALSRHLASPPLVSVIVPAYNEALTIEQSVRALLALDYEPCEIVVVNDGSADGTLKVLKEAFGLIAAPVAFATPLASAPVRGLYRSAREPALLVIDKEQGGSKSDALNAGINAASGDLVLTVDADTLLDPAALRCAVLPFLEDPRTVGVGSNVAIANGCRIEGVRIVEVALPDSWLARFQIIEYMRSFLLGRVARASQNLLTIVSGAFGLFRRDAVIAVGGYDRTAIGEDMDLTFRLQRHWRRRGAHFHIAFDPSALSSTQAPEDLRSLAAQRCRWRRGLLQVLWRHRGMIGNPRYGVLGMVTLPVTVVFEGLGPLLEIAGYIITAIAVALGLLNWQHFQMLLAASVLFGIAVTLFAVLLNDLATERYLRGRDLGLLVLAAVLENCGYRQLNSWWSCVGTVQAMTGKSGWGVIKRRDFRAVLFVLFVTLTAARAAAQDDVLAKARALATSGHRSDAIAMLETHLAASPRDVDARLLYGLILSWEGRYDEARVALRAVLAQAPNYTDARIALMNVEYWSGHSSEAKDLADEILSKNPGNATARTVHDRIEAAHRPWWIKSDYTVDEFNDDREPWRETTASLNRATPIGSVIVRGSWAERFGDHDELGEVEFYPRFRPGTYAFLGAGYSQDHGLYPHDRFAFDLYQSLGHGFEASGGARFLDFGTVTKIYVATVSKYVGNWMLTFKVFRVPADNDLDSTTYHGGFRHYYGSAGTSYIGFNYSHGLSKEEVYSAIDLVSLHADTVRGDFDHLFKTRYRVYGSAGTSRQERANRFPLWQTTLSIGFGVQF
jgi:YaiO family outer membrane protein